MLTFLFFVLLFGIFGKLIWLAVRAAWGISKAGLCGAGAAGGYWDCFFD